MYQDNDSRAALKAFPAAPPDLAKILWELKCRGGSGSIVELEGIARGLSRFSLEQILTAAGTPWGAERIDSSRTWVFLRELKKLGERNPKGVASIAPFMARWMLHEDPGGGSTRSGFTHVSEYEGRNGQYAAAVILAWVRGLKASEPRRASCAGAYFANIDAPHCRESLRQLLEIMADEANPQPAEAAGIILEGQQTLPAEDEELKVEAQVATVLTKDGPPRVRLSAIRCAGKLTSPPKAGTTLLAAVESTISGTGDFCVRLEAFGVRTAWDSDWPAEWATNLVDAALAGHNYKSPDGQAMDQESWLANALSKLGVRAVPALVYGAERERAMSGWPGHFLGALNELVEKKPHAGRPDDVRNACCAAASEHAEAIAKLVSNATGHSGYRSRTALKVLGSIGAVDSLATRIRDDKTASEKFGVSGFYWIYRHNPRARPAILALLQDPDKAVCTTVLLAVSAIRVWSGAEYEAVQALFYGADHGIAALAATAYVTHSGPETGDALLRLAQLCQPASRDEVLKAIYAAGWVYDTKPQSKDALRFAACDTGLADWAGTDNE